jgi:hypothetical protein
MAHVDLKVLNGGSEKLATLEKGSSEWGQRLLKETKSLVEQVEVGYMQLAHRLWLAHDTPVDGDPSRPPIYTTFGYSTFREYADKGLNFHYKKAERLRAMWKVLAIDLSLDEKMLQRFSNLGVSKVRELVREGVLTTRNVEAWLSKAESMSYQKVDMTVRKYLDDKALQKASREAEELFNPKGTADIDDAADAAAGEDIRRIEETHVSSMTFQAPLVGDQIETVLLAFKRAEELSGSDKKGYNLSLICLDFLATNDFKFANEEQRIRFLAKYENLMGLKLVVVDPEAEEIVYGMETLEKLAHRKEG